MTTRNEIPKSSQENPGIFSYNFSITGRITCQKVELRNICIILRINSSLKLDLNSSFWEANIKLNSIIVCWAWCYFRCPHALLLLSREYIPAPLPSVHKRMKTRRGSVYLPSCCAWVLSRIHWGRLTSTRHILWGPLIRPKYKCDTDKNSYWVNQSQNNNNKISFTFFSLKNLFCNFSEFTHSNKVHAACHNYLQDLSYRLNKTYNIFYRLQIERFIPQHEWLQKESEWHCRDFANYLCSEYDTMVSWSNLPPSLLQSKAITIHFEMESKRKNQIF